jgi:serine/threonine protein kinase
MKAYEILTCGVTGVLLLDKTDKSRVVKCYNYQLYYDAADIVKFTAQQQLVTYNIANKKCKPIEVQDNFNFSDQRAVLLQIEQYKKELKILRKLSGKKNIIQILGDGVEKEGILLGIKMERMTTDLFFWIYRKRKAKDTVIAEDLVLHLTEQLLQGVSAIHDIAVAHLDIKPANLLINDKNELKITDFGNAIDIIPEGFDHVTPNYRPLELHEKIPYRSFDEVQKADVWSIGCIVYELLYLNDQLLPIKEKMENEDYEKMLTMLKVIDVPLIKYFVTKLVCPLKDRCDIHFAIDLFNTKFSNRLFNF